MKDLQNLKDFDDGQPPPRAIQWKVAPWILYEKIIASKTFWR